LWRLLPQRVLLLRQRKKTMISQLNQPKKNLPMYKNVVYTDQMVIIPLGDTMADMILVVALDTVDTMNTTNTSRQSQLNRKCQYHTPYTSTIHILLRKKCLMKSRFEFHNPMRSSRSTHTPLRNTSNTQCTLHNPTPLSRKSLMVNFLILSSLELNLI
jgi:hypothetical protein